MKYVLVNVLNLPEKKFQARPIKPGFIETTFGSSFQQSKYYLLYSIINYLVMLITQIYTSIIAM